MKNKISKRIILHFALSFCILIFAFCIFSEAQAARLYFEPQELTVGTTREFLVGVNIDADKRVNAFSLAISISEPLIPYDINEANSIINFWVEKPNWDEASRLLTFSGITPGGFEGQKGRLLIIKFKANLEAGLPSKATLGFDKEKTKIYLHTADGIEDLLVLEKMQLPVVKGKENIPVQISDNKPPEWFSPEISQDPNMFGGKWFLVFATQDKGSGIGHYEVCEGKRKCVIAESPHLLQNQNLDKEITVKAVDKNGNERVVILPPQKLLPWYKSYIILAILIITGLIMAGVILRKILWKKFIKSR